MNDQTTDPRNSDPETNRWRQILLNRWLLAGITAVLLYTLVGFLLTPWIVKRYVSNYAVEKLNRKASIEEVRVNPFLFTFEVKNFIFEEANNRPIIGFDRL